jgi:cell wall assembly regulator SMI1
VSPPPPVLDLGLLGELEARWVQQGAPILQNLRGGLTPKEMDEQISSLGLRLPNEAKVWWGWHDGTGAARNRPHDREIGRSLRFLSLAEAVAQARTSIKLAEQTAASFSGEPNTGDPGYWWWRSWLPISPQSGGPIVLDCGMRGEQTSPIRRIDWGADEQFWEPKARSFGELVSWWIDAFDRGAWRYDHGAKQWEYNHQLLPEPLLRSRLV